MTVAVGDVHGCYDLLCTEMRQYYDSGEEIIFLGDLIDRASQPGGDSAVISYIKNMQENPDMYGLSNVVVLKGNHEQMLIDAVKEGTQSRAYALWEYNGGDPTFYHEVRGHMEWFKNLPTYAIRGNYLFVHAGVVPGLAFSEQTAENMRWIREPFLSCEDHGLPYTVVHGHTPTKSCQVEYGAKQINVDTGSFFSGVLGTVVLP